MSLINLNHAATSGATHPEVVRAVSAWLQRGGRLGAGRSAAGLDDEAAILAARQALAGLFGAPGPFSIVFTSGATDSLNIALNGLLRPGDHVLASGVEHNAVARPLHLLAQQGGVAVTYLPCQPDGTHHPEEIARHARPNTRLLVMTHASNVLGTLLPVAECFAEAKRLGLLTLLDAAQTAGHLPVALGLGADLIAFTGHKGLGALPGSGGLVVGPAAAQAIRPWRAGGTGSHSASLEMPADLPARLEPGTPNIPGIIGLGAAARALDTAALAAIQAHGQALTARFIAGALQLGLVVYGVQNAARMAPVVSVTAPGRDPALLARHLAEGHGIITRSGLHCAPLAHRAAGTFPTGTLRFSFGAATTAGELDRALDALAGLV